MRRTGKQALHSRVRQGELLKQKRIRARSKQSHIKEFRNDNR